MKVDMKIAFSVVVVVLLAIIIDYWLDVKVPGVVWICIIGVSVLFLILKIITDKFKSRSTDQKAKSSVTTRSNTTALTKPADVVDLADSHPKITNARSSKKVKLLFRSYSSQFKDAILHPSILAGELYSANIIDEYTRNEISHNTHVRASANLLVDAVEVYLSKQKKEKQLIKEFEKVLNIFKSHTPLDTVIEALKTEYSGHNQNDDSNEREIEKKSIQSTPEVTAAQGQKKGHKRKKKKNQATTEVSHFEKEEHNLSPKNEEVKQLVADASLFDGVTSKKYPQNIKASTPFSKSDSQEANVQCDVDYLSDPHIKQLEVALQVYTSDLSDSGLDTKVTLDRIKARIESHINKKLEDGLSKDVLTKQLNDLTMNALIPMNINDWCYDRLDELCKEHDEKMSNSKDSSSHSSDDFYEDMPPIFSTDVVYHASLCNLVISKARSSHLGMKASLDYLSQFGHSFDKVTLSNDMSILIALQENIIYIAFEGTSNAILPLRYFCELLHQNKRLVFTGFSLGMLPALSFLVQLWNLPYFSAKILLQNVACIMFGFPEGDILSLIQGHVQDSSDILKSLHLFLLDIIDIKPVPSPSFYQRRPLDFYNLQMFKEMVYLIQKTSDGLKYTKSPSFHSAAFEMFTEHISFKCDMQTYHQYVLRGYLDKEQYCIPSRKSLAAGSVESLVPSILKIELCQHKHPGGNELSIVINGDNLWFCSKIEVNFYNFNVMIKTSVESVAQKQICYNHLLDRECLFEDKSTTCQIKVYSRFSNPLKSDVPIIYNEPDLISFRQSQLAKQTPSQIIQLSFLSALLEQSPSVRSGRPTKRFKQIIKFLQEASTIVPMESAIFAVASCDSSSSSAKITQAVVNAAHVSSIPVSKMMISGSAEACDKVMRNRYHQLDYQRSMLYSQPRIYHNYDVIEDPYFGARVSKHFHSFDQEKGFSQPHVRRGKKKHEKLRSSQISALPVQDSGFSISLGPHNHHLSYVERFYKICQALTTRPFPSSLKLISGRNIGELYPISKAVSSPSDSDALTPLSQVLQNARTRLTILSSSHKTAAPGIAEVNISMLQEVNKIVHEYLSPCVTMLGGFMEQQIRVPLVNSPLDTAKALRTAENSGAVGVWALFSLNSNDVKYILLSRKNETLVIQIAKFIEGTLSENIKRKRHDAEPTSLYDAKLQFLLELGRNKTITCSNDYISYSLERELDSICKERGISTSTSVDSVIDNWGDRFKDTALALVPPAYRPLLARWLIWSLNIHQLREGLASYTTVGVIGLVNSGKSTLVNKVFNVETVQGTSQGARTTVPFIYNLDSSVEGLSVIDFPGVDDRDESIGGLAKLLVGLAQIVVFVCGYERFHTSSAMDWMKIFKKDFADTPILVCLTHADRLYENNCEKDMIPECPRSKIEVLRIQFEDELQKIIGDTARTEKCLIKFCSLAQTRHSPLNDDRGRQSMRNIGIFTPEDIGEWVKNALIRDIQQEELADKFSKLLLK